MYITKAILTAMPEEAEKIIERYKLLPVKNIGNLQIYEVLRKNYEGEEEKIVLFVFWVGKIYASFATTYLMENYDPQKIINIGVVGNLNPDLLNIGDVMIPNTFLQHDVYIPSFIDSMKYLRDPIFTEYAVGDEYNFEKFSLHLHGICVTGDQFIDDEEKKKLLVENHKADIVDMEAYAILSVLKNYDAWDKAVMIKSVSDDAGKTAGGDHVANLEAAMLNALAILETVL